MATRASKRPAAKTTRPKTVDGYLAAAPKDKRAALMKLGETIKAAALKPNKPLPYGLITRIVRARIAEIERAG
jgi:uncharacterized protein YdhG (YjbR/CyaY superfamily)